MHELQLALAEAIKSEECFGPAHVAGQQGDSIHVQSGEGFCPQAALLSSWWQQL